MPYCIFIGGECGQRMGYCLCVESHDSIRIRIGNVLINKANKNRKKKKQKFEKFKKRKRQLSEF